MPDDLSRKDFDFRAPLSGLSQETENIQIDSKEVVKDGEKVDAQDVDTVVTAKGSQYKYLPDGRTQRFKQVENRYYEPQFALVYVPSYTWVQKNAPANMMDVLGDNETIYDQIMLEYVQGDGKKCYIVDGKGNKLETNQQIRETQGSIFLTFGTPDKVDFFIPVSPNPIIGFQTFDTRKYVDSSTNQLLRECHLGNKVVRIIKK